MEPAGEVRRELPPPALRTWAPLRAPPRGLPGATAFSRPTCPPAGLRRRSPLAAAAPRGGLGLIFILNEGKKKFLTPLDTASRWRRWRPYHVTGERGSGDRRGGVSPLCRRLSAVTMGTGPRCWQRAPQSGPDVRHRPDSNISLFMALRRG